MNPLTFTLKIKPQFSLDVSELTPDNLAEKNKSQIKNLKLKTCFPLLVTIPKIFRYTAVVTSWFVSARELAMVPSK